MVWPERGPAPPHSSNSTRGGLDFQWRRSPPPVDWGRVARDAHIHTIYIYIYIYIYVSPPAPTPPPGNGMVWSGRSAAPPPPPRGRASLPVEQSGGKPASLQSSPRAKQHVQEPASLLAEQSGQRLRNGLGWKPCVPRSLLRSCSDCVAPTLGQPPTSDTSSRKLPGAVVKVTAQS